MGIITAFKMCVKAGAKVAGKKAATKLIAHGTKEVAGTAAAITAVGGGAKLADNHQLKNNPDWITSRIEHKEKSIKRNQDDVSVLKKNLVTAKEKQEKKAVKKMTEDFSKNIKNMEGSIKRYSKTVSQPLIKAFKDGVSGFSDAIKTMRDYASSAPKTAQAKS